MSNISIANPGSAAPTSAGTISRVPHVWAQPLVCLAITACVITWLLRSTVVSMVSTWYGSRSYSYGFVVAPICVLLIWRERKQLSAMRPVISYAGVAWFVIFAVVWLLGNLGDVQVVQQYAFIAMLEATAWALLGPGILRTLAFPLVFLFLAVPAGESLIAPLQRITAAFTVNAVRLSGVPVVQEGMVLSTPSGNWRIAEACSGIRYLTSSVVVGVLVAGVALHRWKRRILFIVLSVAVPIIANAVRAYLIVMLAYLSDNRIASGVDHIVYGWIFFSLITACLVALGLAWREPAQASQPGPYELVHGSAAYNYKVRLIFSAVVLVAIVVLISSLANLLWSRNVVEAHKQDVIAPEGWMETEAFPHAWDPDIADGESSTFATDGYEVSLYRATYPTTRGGIELINSLNAAGTSGEWEVITTSRRKGEIARQFATVDEYLIASGGQLRLMWIWYVSGSQVMTNGYEVKCEQAKHRILGRPESVSLYAISTSIQNGRANAAVILQKFAAHISL